MRFRKKEGNFVFQGLVVASCSTRSESLRRVLYIGEGKRVTNRDDYVNPRLTYYIYNIIIIYQLNYYCICIILIEFWLLVI